MRKVKAGLLFLYLVLYHLLNHLQDTLVPLVLTIATIEAIRHSFVPRAAGTKVRLTISGKRCYGEGQEADIQYAISNTFSFGGHSNCSI